jgi:hypothetical protein
MLINVYALINTYAFYSDMASANIFPSIQAAHRRNPNKKPNPLPNLNPPVFEIFFTIGTIGMGEFREYPCSNAPGQLREK